MKTIRVNLDQKGYNIVVGNNILRSFGSYLKKLSIGKYAIAITSPNIKKIWGKELSKVLNHSGFNIKFNCIANTEKSKSAQTCLRLLNDIAAYSRSRKVFIIAFGGGVVGDVSGFVASSYKRGIPYVHLPTTLLAQVDSAIGGKVAIDLKVGKNLVGSFYQPRMVFSDIRFLRTLPPKQIKNGISEIIKYGVATDKGLFEFLEGNLEKILKLDRKSIEFVVWKSSQIKAKIVEKDEFDKLDIRAALNYGHTIGHAIEAASGYSNTYTHGMAISIGMVAANFISERLGFISTAETARVERLLKRAGLPIRVKGVAPEKIYKTHLYDKKFIHGKNRFVLPVQIGKAKIAEGIDERIVKKAITVVCEREK